MVARFRYDEGLAEQARSELGRSLEALGQQAGYVSGVVGRAVDDPTLWVLTTSWANVGAYRRALSSYDIKMHVVPLLAHALDEPSAYEILVGDGAVAPNQSRPRGGG